MKALRLVDRERIKVQLQWEPRDMWVGLFWRISERERCDLLHLYVCVVPMLPLHVTVLWRWGDRVGDALKRSEGW